MADMSKDEQIGYHKGALATLAKEREEFTKILGIVEQLMHAHIEELKKLGVDLHAQAEAAKSASGADIDSKLKDSLEKNL